MGIRFFVVDAELTFTDALISRLEAEDDVDAATPVQPRMPSLPITSGPCDIVLIDADLPKNAALDLAANLSGRAGKPRVVMLSRGSDPERIIDFLSVGATAWVRKDESLEHLLRVIKGVAVGEVWLPPSHTGAILRLLLDRRDRTRERDEKLAALTPREREVLSYMAAGAGRRDLARQLHVSANTVRTHLQNLMAKLGVHSVLEAVALTRSQLDTSAHLPSGPLGVADRALPR
jgi:DNA-binding NarL/FixJ family response regulator